MKDQSLDKYIASNVDVTPWVKIAYDIFKMRNLLFASSLVTSSESQGVLSCPIGPFVILILQDYTADYIVGSVNQYQDGKIHPVKKSIKTFTLVDFDGLNNFISDCFQVIIDTFQQAQKKHPSDKRFP